MLPLFLHFLMTRTFPNLAQYLKNLWPWIQLSLIILQSQSALDQLPIAPLKSISIICTYNHCKRKYSYIHIPIYPPIHCIISQPFFNQKIYIEYPLQCLYIIKIITPKQESSLKQTPKIKYKKE
ncbi:hypothetical protein F4703DRAFT_1583591, partial [Phycomyces blakesleeanus]